jgi:hypothetical protein
MKNKLTFVIAPDIPTSELKALKKHWKEAAKDSKYTLVTNYEMRVDVFKYNPDRDQVVVIAPDIPTPEVTALLKRVTKATKKKEAIVFVNHEVCVFRLPKSSPSAKLL